MPISLVLKAVGAFCGVLIVRMVQLL